MENPPEETPGWHSSELETSQDMAWNHELVRMERAKRHPTLRSPTSCPSPSASPTAPPMSSSRATQYFSFPMDHHEFIESGMIGNPMRATKEKGEEAFRSYSEHVAEGVLELMTVPVKVENREFVDRVM